METKPSNQPNELETLKGYLEDYLKTTSYYNPSKKYANKFLCRNPEHVENRPSMSLEPGKKFIHCFSCGATYSIIDLAILDNDLGNLEQPIEARLKDREAIGKACKYIKDLFNITGNVQPRAKTVIHTERPKEDLEALFNKGVYGNPLKEYLFKRGITDEELISKLQLRNRYGDNGDRKGYIMIPYNLTGPKQLITERVISLEDNKPLSELPKELRYKHHGGLLTYDPFNYLNYSKKRAVFITEGEIDTISFYQALKELRGSFPFSVGSVALGGAKNSKSLINLIKGDSLPNKGELTFILALDKDARGEQAQRDLRAVLEASEVNYCIFDYGTVKDANELLTTNKDLFKSKISETVLHLEELTRQAHKEYMEIIDQEAKAEREKYINENSVLGYLNKFIDHRENPVKASRTFWAELDSKLNGGLREGLITVGAVSSLGKTSFILQLADQLAQTNQKDIFYFSLEMSRDELISKSLNRLEYLESCGATQNIRNQVDIMSSNYNNWSNQERDLFNLAIEDYKSYADRLFIKEGVNNFGVLEVEAAIKEHIAKTNRTPIIIIDYLQILASPDNHLTDKQATDKNILFLKQLSRDLHTTIVVVSSLNRSSYSQDVSLSSFKESGAIEYTSDVILGLNYALTDAEREELKDVRAKTKGLPDEEKDKLIEDFYKTIRAHTPRNIRLTILKNRQGEKDKDIDFYFYPQFNIFIEQLQSLEVFKELLEHSKSKTSEEFTPSPFI